MTSPIVYTATPETDAGLSLNTLKSGAVSPSGLSGDSFANTGFEKLFVVNGAGSPITVDLGEGPCEWGTDHDPAKSIGANDVGILGPFPVSEYGTTISPVYSSITSVTVFVLRTVFKN